MKTITGNQLNRSGISNRFSESTSFNSKEALDILQYSHFKNLKRLFSEFEAYKSENYIKFVENMVSKALLYSDLDKDLLQFNEVFHNIKDKKLNFDEMYQLTNPYFKLIDTFKGPHKLAADHNGYKVFLSALMLYYINLIINKEVKEYEVDQDDLSYLHKLFLNLIGIPTEFLHAQVESPLPENITLIDIEEAIQAYTNIIKSIE